MYKQIWKNVNSMYPLLEFEAEEKLKFYTLLFMKGKIFLSNSLMFSVYMYLTYRINLEIVFNNSTELNFRVCIRISGTQKKYELRFFMYTSCANVNL